jgi:hypothetical protein
MRRSAHPERRHKKWMNLNSSNKLMLLLIFFFKTICISPLVCIEIESTVKILSLDLMRRSERVLTETQRYPSNE